VKKVCGVCGLRAPITPRLGGNCWALPIQAQPGAAIGPFHWNNRRLTFQELCRLQTFPDGLSLVCGRTEMQRMLGNAVPSLIAEILAREIRRQLLDTPWRGHCIFSRLAESLSHPPRTFRRFPISIASTWVLMTPILELARAAPQCE
jgi:hypothetical protein